MELNELAQKYVLDKHISLGHNYIPAYIELFGNIRNDVKNVLEIGIGSIENGQMIQLLDMGYKTGNSLRCWNEYFPNANIFGIDIYKHDELNQGKIKTFVANQFIESDLINVINNINNKLDIIIDDGSHIGEHQAFSFMVLHKYMTTNGLYIIEDVQADNIEKFKDLSIFPPDFIQYIHENFTIKYYDTRHVIGRIDDFMVCFIKK
jgi:hypothetical protein